MGIFEAYDRVQSLIYYVVVAGLGIFGAMMIYMSIIDFNSGEVDLGGALVLMSLSLIPLGFPLLVVHEKVRDRKLSRWLVEHIDRLGEGAVGPGGNVYSFDTQLVRYRANLSLVVVSTGIESGFYLSGSNHLIPRTLYTLFAAFFGWWMLDPGVWLNNATAIIGNLRNSNIVTVGELLASADQE